MELSTSLWFHGIHQLSKNRESRHSMSRQPVIAMGRQRTSTEKGICFIIECISHLIASMGIKIAKHLADHSLQSLAPKILGLKKAVVAWDQAALSSRAAGDDGDLNRLGFD